MYVCLTEATCSKLSPRFSELLIQKQSDKEFDLDHQYYPCVVIHALMSILEDKSQTEIHSKVIQIIVTVFQVCFNISRKVTINIFTR